MSECHNNVRGQRMVMAALESSRTGAAGSGRVVTWGPGGQRMTDQSLRRRLDGKRALVVRGGWEGHAPVPATDRYVRVLKEAGLM